MVYTMLRFKLTRVCKRDPRPHAFMAIILRVQLQIMIMLPILNEFE